MRTSSSIVRVISEDHVRTEVNQCLERYLNRAAAQAATAHADYGQLWRVLRSVLLHGGKRLRPYLFLVAYQAYSDSDYHQVLPAAAAQELLHGSLLIHDDILDNDYVRHGQLNVAGTMRQVYAAYAKAEVVDRYASGAALLGGDLLLSASHDIVLTSQMSDAQKIQVITDLTTALFTVGGGELLDLESSLRPVSASHSSALQIAELKTAYYTFVAPLCSGARLANAPAADIAVLKQYGTELGIAYQLVDDLLGMYGDEAQTGKSSSSDIREGKVTYLVEQAWKLASLADLSVLRAALGNEHVQPKQIAAVRGILSTCGARQAVLDAVSGYTLSAISKLDNLSISAASRTVLSTVASQATTRLT